VRIAIASVTTSVVPVRIFPPAAPNNKSRIKKHFSAMASVVQDVKVAAQDAGIIEKPAATAQPAAEAQPAAVAQPVATVQPTGVSCS